ncbi:MAG: ArpU family phage packaging/lysis transcriptional regulator [Aerococcus sp.]|nr:ArpU family phage packaging/lysis transcriptional regulator [Aerococcus sp.]
MVLFPEIDEEKTVKNVDALLKKCHMIRRLAGEPVPQRLTSVLTSTPKSPSYQNTNESNLFKKLDCESTFQEINRALSTLDQHSQNLLWGKYISSDRYYDYEFYSQMAISKTTYYMRLNRARLDFAESYNGGELLAVDKR